MILPVGDQFVPLQHDHQQKPEWMPMLKGWELSWEWLQFFNCANILIFIVQFGSNPISSLKICF